MAQATDLHQEFDAGAEAWKLWHELWADVEDDLPTLADGPYPSYARVKAFEERIRERLERAYEAGRAAAATASRRSR
jgi:hypothetical protein